MSIIISQNNKNAKRLDKLEFGLEQDIQQYIYDNPDTIPIYEVDSDIRLFVAAREFSTNSGPIDALAFDQYGNIYVVETKLFRNPDKRTVVAQALDYGASLWRHSTNFEAFIDQLGRHTSKQFGKNFQDAFCDFFGIDDASEAFVAISNNLNSGNIKFVVLMDKLHNRLKDLIVYINQNSHFDIYAVEVEYYKYDSFEIIIPKLYGAEVKKEVVSKKASGNYSYTDADKQAFISNISSHRDLLSDKAAEALSELLSLFEQIASQVGREIDYSKSERTNRFIANIKGLDGKWVLSVYSNGEIWSSKRDDEDDEVFKYTRRVLNRLIDEKLFNKTEKNLAATQWAVMLTNSRKNPSADKEIARLVEICREEGRFSDDGRQAR